MPACDERGGTYSGSSQADDNPDEAEEEHERMGACGFHQLIARVSRRGTRDSRLAQGDSAGGVETRPPSAIAEPPQITHEGLCRDQ